MPLENNELAEVIERAAISPETRAFIDSNREDFALLVKAVLQKASENMVAMREVLSQTGDVESTFKLLLDVAKDAVVILNDQGNVVEWNKAAVSLFGYSKEEVVGQSLHDLLTSRQDKTEISQQTEQFARTGQAEVMQDLNELWATHKDGSRVPIELSLSAFEVRGSWKALGVVRDLSQRKQQEQKMQALNKLIVDISTADSEKAALELCLDSTIALIGADGGCAYLLDDMGKEVEVGCRGVGEDRGLLERELSVGNLKEVQVPVMYKERVLAYMKFYYKDPSKYDLQAQYWLENIISQVSGVLERIKVAARVQQMQKMEAIGQLAGGIAHDFNNVLTVMLGNMQLVADNPVGAPMTEDHIVSLQDGIESGHHGAELTKSLLAFARRQVLEKQLMTPGPFLEEKVRQVRRWIGDDVTMKLKVARDVSVIKVDVTQLEQILMNLLVNVRHAMPEGGNCIIEAKNVDIGAHNLPDSPEAREGGFVEISVADTGCGIDAAHLKSIFEPFFTTKSKDIGTGLGLATVYGLMAQHQGFVTVKSQKGKGTVFRLYFPRVEEEAPSSRMNAQCDFVKGNETILVIEDESAVLKVVERILGRCGYQVLSAGSPEQARKILAQKGNEIDLILSDVMMPGQRGDRFVSEVQRDYPKIKTLLMSGNVEGPALDAISMDMLVSKPFQNNELPLKVRKALGKSKQK